MIADNLYKVKSILNMHSDNHRTIVIIAIEDILTNTFVLTTIYQTYRLPDAFLPPMISKPARSFDKGIDEQLHPYKGDGNHCTAIAELQRWFW